MMHRILHLRYVLDSHLTTITVINKKIQNQYMENHMEFFTMSVIGVQVNRFANIELLILMIYKSVQSFYKYVVFITF